MLIFSINMHIVKCPKNDKRYVKIREIINSISPEFVIKILNNNLNRLVILKIGDKFMATDMYIKYVFLSDYKYDFDHIFIHELYEYIFINPLTHKIRTNEEIEPVKAFLIGINKMKINLNDHYFTHFFLKNAYEYYYKSCGDNFYIFFKWKTNIFPRNIAYLITTHKGEKFKRLIYGGNYWHYSLTRNEEFMDDYGFLFKIMKKSARSIIYH